MFGKKKNNLPKMSVEARVEAIRALGNGKETSKKKKGEDNESAFYQLIEYLSDEAPECRIAAAEMLGKTSRDVAVTHLSHRLDNEKDENVINAIKKAIVSIRKNEKH